MKTFLDMTVEILAYSNLEMAGCPRPVTVSVRILIGCSFKRDRNLPSPRVISNCGDSRQNYQLKKEIQWRNRKGFLGIKTTTKDK